MEELEWIYDCVCIFLNCLCYHTMPVSQFLSVNGGCPKCKSVVVVLLLYLGDRCCLRRKDFNGERLKLAVWLYDCM